MFSQAHKCGAFENLVSDDSIKAKLPIQKPSEVMYMPSHVYVKTTIVVEISTYPHVGAAFPVLIDHKVFLT